MSRQDSIRELLLEQMSGRNAHVDFYKSVEGLRLEELGQKPEGFDHSIWELVEHIRIAQHDILEFSRDPEYESPNWPEGYWPDKTSPADKKEWESSLETIERESKEMEELIKNPENDLLAPFPHGDGQTLFREAMLIVDHNAYHIGQIVQLRKALGAW